MLAYPFNHLHTLNPVYSVLMNLDNLDDEIAATRYELKVQEMKDKIAQLQKDHEQSHHSPTPPPPTPTTLGGDLSEEIGLTKDEIEETKALLVAKANLAILKKKE